MESTSARSIGYTLRELGRRAGVSSAEIARWRFAMQDGRVVLYPMAGSDKRISFAFDARKSNRVVEFLQAAPAKFDDAVVPFDRSKGGGLLFVAGEGEEVRCRADVLTATLWTLSRVEERYVRDRDEHGRFCATVSVAHAGGFLNRPIVDEYGLALRRALQRLLPGWEPRSSSFRAMLSHDIDLVGLPRRMRTAIGHLVTRRSPRAFVTDVLSAVLRSPTAYLNAAVALQRESARRRLRSAFYWMAASKTTQYDSAYDPRQRLVRDTIERLRRDGAENGIHPGYDTFGSAETLAAEIARLAEVTGTVCMGGRQHYLRWDPDTWTLWERAGLVYDSSVGFADGVGFRAGTAYPYHPWLFEEDREAALLEIPLIVMDCAPVAYMRLGEADTLSRIGELVGACRRVGGVFSLLWHNTSVIEQPYARLYPRILHMLEDAKQYEWENDRALLPLPQIVEPAAAP